ncbi:mRNA cap guanine-N7 methyltransferase 1-like [Brassica napus]|uniref:mRNA cap guanine-N7 methyltransferase 1-like n=1 Tax=Brassica napus TaxID=3708 RepID=UPI0006AB755B|nr:mRNA cap guanine-N7 methyltransferase 1-like [Brassica napus]
MPDANVIIKKLRQAEGLEIANSVYWIRFGEWFSQKKFKSSSPFGIEYVFTLRLTLSHEQYDLELVFVKNSHEFVHEYMKKTEFVELMRRLGALGDGNQDQSTLSTDEWDAAYLYLSFVLRKRGGESDGGQRRGERRKNGKINLSKDDVLYIDNESVKECNFTQQRVS